MILAKRNSNIRLIATNDENGNNPKNNIRVIDDKKLRNIYKEFRKHILIGEPIQENLGDNNLVFRGDYRINGNYYGWQLFKTLKGTAILEYRGGLIYYPHERKPLPLEEETELEELYLTFHQKEMAVEKAREIIRNNTKSRR